MAIKRVVEPHFWIDGKIEDFSPEERYFYLYLLTNPFTTQLGIYEISFKQAAFQLGYSVDKVSELIEKFENEYGVIIFSERTSEIALLNYLRHSIIKGGKPVYDCLVKEIKNVKNKELIIRVFSHIDLDNSLNKTVRDVIDEYEKTNSNLCFQDENKNDNDNDNEERCYDSNSDSCKMFMTNLQNSGWHIG